jgi:hypothetical protein
MHVRQFFFDFFSDEWISRSLRRELLKGPGTLCFVFSASIAALGLILNLTFFGSPGLAPLLFLGAALATGLVVLYFDLYDCYENHRLILLRRIALRCVDRLDLLKIKSEPISDFVQFVCCDKELEERFKNASSESIALIIKTLDRLTSTALRYGQSGRHVFLENQLPLIRSIRLLRSLPADIADDVLFLPLLAWVGGTPNYDPEGWSLLDRTPIFVRADGV